MFGKVRVFLHELCLKARGEEEYPHGWIGTVAGASIEEGLWYVRFARPFIGKSEDGHRPERKTDSQNGMLIPFTLLTDEEGVALPAPAAVQPLLEKTSRELYLDKLVREATGEAPKPAKQRKPWARRKPNTTSAAAAVA